jgi:hypothetical protein
MIYTIVRAGAVVTGTGAASRYISGSDQMMRLRLRNTAFQSIFPAKKIPKKLGRKFI